MFQKNRDSGLYEYKLIIHKQPIVCLHNIFISIFSTVISSTNMQHTALVFLKDIIIYHYFTYNLLGAKLMVFNIPIVGV